jgi:hypothetical protein
VQKIVEIAPGPRELLPEVLATDLQERGPDEVGHSENLAEDVNQALLAIEAQQHPRGATDSGFVHQQLHIAGTDLGSGRSISGVASRLSPYRVKVHPAASARPRFIFNT